MEIVHFIFAIIGGLSFLGGWVTGYKTGSVSNLGFPLLLLNLLSIPTLVDSFYPDKPTWVTWLGLASVSVLWVGGIMTKHPTSEPVSKTKVRSDQ